MRAIIEINGVIYNRSVLTVEKLRRLGLSDAEIKTHGFEIKKPVKKRKSKKTDTKIADKKTVIKTDTNISPEE